MKRINAILVLLLAIGLVAGSVLPPAAHAVSMSGTDSGLQGSPSTTLLSAAGGGSKDGDGAQGDPGGAGDGLGATPEILRVNAVQDTGAGAVVEFVLQLLRLVQAAG